MDLYTMILLGVAGLLVAYLGYRVSRNKTKRIKVGVDVDCVVVPTDNMWWEWLKEVTDKDLNLKPKDYDYTKYFKEELGLLGLDGFEFWRDESLYDNVKPFAGAVMALEYIQMKRNAEIVFISTLKGNHHKSKVAFLKKWFNFAAFLGTKEKEYVDVDVMIDDRREVLDRFPGSVKKILFPAAHNGGIGTRIEANNFWYKVSREVASF